MRQNPGCVGRGTPLGELIFGPTSLHPLNLFSVNNERRCALFAWPSPAGSTIPVATEGFTAYTLREPIGVVGQIIREWSRACRGSAALGEEQEADVRLHGGAADVPLVGTLPGQATSLFAVLHRCARLHLDSLFWASLAAGCVTELPALSLPTLAAWNFPILSEWPGRRCCVEGRLLKSTMLEAG